jgi:NAD(P)H-quinone oxidoreductase subunit 6
VPTPGDALFFLVAGAVIASAAGVAFARNILHAALSLLGTLLGVGALFIFLSADFLAVTQLLIYVGGVLVLILFAVMLTQRIEDRSNSNPSKGTFGGAVLLLGLLGLFSYLAVTISWPADARTPAGLDTTTERIGDLLLGHWLVVFEVISLLLLATLVGAVVVARREPST